MKSAAVCKDCDNTGVRDQVTTRCDIFIPPGWHVVERCDACEYRFDSDLAAAKTISQKARWADCEWACRCEDGGVHAIAKGKAMRDKNDTPLGIGDLVISTYRESAGKIYRIKGIKDIVDLAAAIQFLPKGLGSSDYLTEQNRLKQAHCTSVCDRLLAPKKRGTITSYGLDIIKVDKKFAAEMAKKWSKLLTG